MAYHSPYNQLFETTYANPDISALDYLSQEKHHYLLPLSCTYPPNASEWPLPTPQLWQQQSPFTISPISNVISDEGYSGLSWSPNDQNFSPSSQISPQPEYKNEFGYETQPSTTDEEAGLIKLEVFGQVGNDYKDEEILHPNVASAETHHVFYRTLPQHTKRNTSPRSKKSPTPKTKTKSKSTTPQPHMEPKHLLTTTAPPSHTPLSPAAASPSTPKPKLARNKVEKSYRTRLNSEFQALQQILPQDTFIPGMRLERKSGARKGASKGDVLVLAKERIGQLEEEGWCLERERALLAEKLEAMRAWEGGNVDNRL